MILSECMFGEKKILKNMRVILEAIMFETGECVIMWMRNENIFY